MMKNISEIRKNIRQKFQGDAECNMVRVGNGPWFFEITVNMHNVIAQGNTEPDAWHNADQACDNAKWNEKTREWEAK